MAFLSGFANGSPAGDLALHKQAPANDSGAFAESQWNALSCLRA
jgi:hypothetical protein